MANIQNLRPRKMTSETAAEIGRKGGLASGEAKRNSKRLKQYMDTILDMDIKDEKVKKELIDIGIAKKHLNNCMRLVLSLYNSALNGNIPAFKEIRKIVEEEEETNDIYEHETLEEKTQAILKFMRENGVYHKGNDNEV